MQQRDRTHGFVEACAHDGGGYWMFSGGKALKYPNSGTRLVYRPAPVAVRWPMMPEPFRHRLDACTHAGNGYWFFSGDRALKYPNSDSAGHLVRPMATLTTYWPEMPEPFAAGIDACVHDEGGYWFFSGDQAVKFPNSGRKPVREPAPITAYWPRLPEPFSGKIDAICHIEGAYWLFSGGQALKYTDKGNTILAGPAPVASSWPSLVW
ncbi:hypothetical protein ACFVUH_02405 [Kitasatospora sp. NPDC058032]|uniref:hypothetical protein n=1 Tax=Kitasatospora sp. NPDC058032 TaxID=3346307 RepID=UPI0036DAEE36